MPNPKITYGTSTNPYSTVNIPPFSLRAEKTPWANTAYTGLAASQTYTFVSAANTPVDIEPGLYLLAVPDVAEVGLFYFPGSTFAIVKIGGSTNIVAGASPGATQISLNNNSGVLEIKTGSGTLVGTTVMFKRID